ncbi:uncharacterized protein METZ01_LOCUS41995 [marine metagenome]|uniref:Uncharacterized protein n=1 Tax=marine metagenome TaxID=408172 RepID=A0A381RC04_9ZZZZ
MEKQNQLKLKIAYYWFISSGITMD